MCTRKKSFFSENAIFGLSMYFSTRFPLVHLLRNRNKYFEWYLALKVVTSFAELIPFVWQITPLTYKDPQISSYQMHRMMVAGQHREVLIICFR